MSSIKKENIVIILVLPENPDNIGAAARAVKNMGFSALRIVKPPRQWKTKAKKMAMSAKDILEKAEKFRSLQEAIQDLGLVIGTTRRAGGHRGVFLSFDKTIEKARGNSLRQKIGIVFGRESKGLANEDSALCDHLVTIPTGHVYPSVNLAQAVMVLLFALSWGREASKEVLSERALNKKEIEITIACFEEALKALGYKKGGADLLPRILKTFRGLLKRSGLWEPEAQMIKGFSRKIREKVLSCPRSASTITPKESQSHG
jgi:tRNA/rRNA methyltransferase